MDFEKKNELTEELGFGGTPANALVEAPGAAPVVLIEDGLGPGAVDIDHGDEARYLVLGRSERHDRVAEGGDGVDRLEVRRKEREVNGRGAQDDRTGAVLCLSLLLSSEVVQCKRN